MYVSKKRRSKNGSKKRKVSSLYVTIKRRSENALINVINVVCYNKMEGKEYINNKLLSLHVSLYVSTNVVCYNKKIIKCIKEYNQYCMCINNNKDQKKRTR